MCCDLAARGFRLEEIVGRLREKRGREGRHEKAQRDDYVVGTARKALSAAAVPEANAEPLSIKPMRSVMASNPTKTPYVIQKLLRRGEELMAEMQKEHRWITGEVHRGTPFPMVVSGPMPPAFPEPG